MAYTTLFLALSLLSLLSNASENISQAEYELVCVLPEAKCRCIYCKEGMTYDDLKSCPHVTYSYYYENQFYYDLSFCGLKELPSSFSSTIAKLDVSFNSITLIPGEIAASLFDLEGSLRISYNPISSVGFNGKTLTNIRSLDLSHLQLTSIPAVLSGSSLRSLSLAWNKFTTFQTPSLNYLNSLELQGNQLTQHPLFESLPSLCSLDLSWNSITYIPTGLSSLYSLKYYDIRHNAVSNIGLGAFKKLLSSYSYYHSLSLDLSYNSLSSLPSDMTSYTALGSLYLPFNNFTTFPEELLGMDYLTVLDFSGNGMVSIPATLYQMEYLRNLNVSRNSLTTIPPKLMTISGFKLNASMNMIKSINLPSVSSSYYCASMIDLSHNRLSSLTVNSKFYADYLNVSNNNLTYLPDIGHVWFGINAENNQISSVGGFRKYISFLNFDNNKLRNLNRFADLPSLAVLRARNNKIRSVPQGLFGAYAPSLLDLSYNRILSVPRIGSSSYLKDLNLEHNSIREISISSYLFSKLHTIKLAYNALTTLPDLTEFTRCNLTVDGNCFTCDYAEEKLPSRYISKWTCNESTMGGERCSYKAGMFVPGWLSGLTIGIIFGFGSIFYFALMALSYL